MRKSTTVIQDFYLLGTDIQSDNYSAFLSQIAFVDSIDGILNKLLDHEGFIWVSLNIPLHQPALIRLLLLLKFPKLE